MENNRNALIDLDLSETTGLTSIDEEAFANCVSLNSVMLPDSNFEFETNVFNNANNLTELKFNKNTNITTNLGLIFNGCNKLFFKLLFVFYVHKDTLNHFTCKVRKLGCEFCHFF